ncbi:tRNA threonylcarbamoyl adenosine modification protein YjeE [Corynebacterium simulans]|uniref:tRNA (adenosine(37)-N6)-threonylcarbamoyltransferase complex ATPase subunit type 1 TsaE n=1 Tax=Corynebacterium TaxID=1716 RepID=UPI00078116A4|nr:tRNA (adenosine(37)-N6)-threonylcarbamoyltransferase complex ATPase subunit type 1 TsaE [Corynebacterium simulans]AMO91305.1 tRNA threonylcarbamoyl adenosine modification protein YjeE [Corynebacterium simulans]MCG7247060.1 tRNA (adenosine(37)-N6)-threonylcarbamoyltransferase complex ATPase subunit type 1 TsaE [Corynebacterium simulans]MCK6160805.1 tRNA (adenosine(37)-N6)-threonylcarbamoyltransferase complex ATPase subunit type 1 TsaE [Corynebacterium simulans]MDU3173979.1 tRNA (adenosine(37)
MRSQFPQQGQKQVATAEAARELGKELGAALEAGDLVILDGPLGAGKTTFTQGIAEGMQVKGRVTSPTFVIAREHRSTVGGPALVHVDAYRLLDHSDDPLGELDALDLDTELDDAVVVAEWGGGFMDQLAEAFLLININREAADDTRVFTWNWVG